MNPFRFASILLLAAGPLGAAPGSALFQQMQAQYQKDYGIELVANDEPFPVEATKGVISAKNAGPRNVDMVLYFLRKEFAKYPPELLKASGVQRIVLCHDLTSHGKPIAGVAVQANHTIYMDSTTSVGDESHRRRTLHHEFFHCLDYAQHENEDIRHNAAWEAENAPNTSYGATPPPAKPGQSNWASHPAPGIVSDYALSMLPEDRAELFAGLMTNNLTLRLLLQRDTYLAAKARVLKAELQAFCPQMDDAFWTRLAKNF